MARLLTYNYLINKYIFNNQICKYNNYLPDKPKKFTFNTTDDVKKFIQYYHFKNHDFGDLSLTDIFVIKDGTYNKNWLIAGFNTQLDSDVNNGTFGKHHLTLIPANEIISTVRMDDEFLNNKGFTGTEMFNITLPEINNNLSNIFQNHLLPHKTMLSIDNNVKMKSFIAKSMLLNYIQAFGVDLPYQYYIPNDSYREFTQKYTNNDFDNGDDIFQLPLFKKDVKYRTTLDIWWLRNVYSSNSFACVKCYGTATKVNATYSFQGFAPYVVRPFICFG